MAKDDYSYLVFKILTYLYGCFKRKYSFDKDAFNKAVVRKEDIAEEYLIDILKNLSDEEMIKGLVFQKIWGWGIYPHNRSLRHEDHIYRDQIS